MNAPPPPTPRSDPDANTPYIGQSITIADGEASLVLTLRSIQQAVFAERNEIITVEASTQSEPIVAEAGEWVVVETPKGRIAFSMHLASRESISIDPGGNKDMTFHYYRPEETPTPEQ